MSACRAPVPPPARIESTFAYDRVGNVVGLVDPRGVETRYEVTALNEIVVETRGASVATAVAREQLLTGEAAKGYTTRREYDHNGRAVRIEVEDADSSVDINGGFVDTILEYDILDKVVSGSVEVEDGRFLVTSYRYDGHELPIETVMPEGNVYRVEYDERHLPFRITRGFGSTDESTFQIDYDRNGNRVRVTDAVDTDGVGGVESTLFAYDGFDRLRETTDALGNVAQRSYDPASHVVRLQSLGHPAGAPGSGRGAARRRRASS